MARHGPYRVLLLSPFPPRLDGVHGASRAIARLITELARRHRVALACLRARDEPGTDAAVSSACELVRELGRAGASTSSIRPWYRAAAVLPSIATGKPLWVAARWSGAFARQVRDLVAAWQPELVQAEFSAMAQYFPATAGARAARVIVLHEPGVLAARQQIARSGLTRGVWQLDARLWTRFERRALDAADAAVVFTRADASAVAALGGRARVEVIPIGTHVPAVAADPAGVDPPHLLFVGNFMHPPNVDGARWLLEEIFPPLRARFPSLRLWLVGQGLPRAVVERACEGVEVVGRVPDVWPYLDRAAAVVAPLREGGGMRVKVLEAMAAGKAVVATRLAMRGIAATAGEHALVADDAASFRAAVTTLLEDPERRARIGGAGREWVSRHRGWDRTAAAYTALYERLLESVEPSARSVP